jgi:FMN phosphatase YigB (HAD superfamily)
MTKPALVVDLDGALLKERPFDMAHKEWFRIMAEIVRDQTVNEYAFKDDYFVYVQEVMKRYLGDISVESRNAFARNIYAMGIVEAVKKWDLVEEFAEHLRLLKKKYLIVLITTAPELAVDAILEKVHCGDLFDVIVRSPMHMHPSKKELFEMFIKKHGKPLFYIGKGDEDVQTCKDLGIKTITVNWVEQGKFKGNFEAFKIEDVDKILERYSFDHDSKV